MPSVQLATYLQLRADGATVEAAAEETGIGIVEARLHEQSIERGELELPRARASARAREGEPTKEGMDMPLPDETTVQVGTGPKIPLADFVEAGKRAQASTDTGQRLKQFIERAERFDEEIKDLNSDKSELFKEMKSEGFDTTTIKRIIKLRKMEPHARQEAEALLSTYMDAIGMTPIEQAIAIAA